MSVYSRCVDARGTTTIESTPAFFYASNPLFSSRCGSGACDGLPDGAPPSPGLAKYGATLKPYSDWMPSDGTTGLTGGTDTVPAPLDPDDSLSSATAVSTRGSIPCTYDTANAPSEWPMIASLVVRPGVTVCLSGRRSNRFQYG